VSGNLIKKCATCELRWRVFRNRRGSEEFEPPLPWVKPDRYANESAEGALGARPLWPDASGRVTAHHGAAKPGELWRAVRPSGGESWRTWYDGAACDGGAFSVRTTDLYEHRFSLRDGRVVGRRLVWRKLAGKPVGVCCALVSLASIWLMAVRVFRWTSGRRAAQGAQAP
jgi:hypothetical protein